MNDDSQGRSYARARWSHFCSLQLAYDSIRGPLSRACQDLLLCNSVHFVHASALRDARRKKSCTENPKFGARSPFTLRLVACGAKKIAREKLRRIQRVCGITAAHVAPYAPFVQRSCCNVREQQRGARCRRADRETDGDECRTLSWVNSVALGGPIRTSVAVALDLDGGFGEASTIVAGASGNSGLPAELNKPAT
jgi:hypothetical protein